MSSTRFEEYEKKTGVIFLIIGGILLVSFFFGLFLLSGDDDVYNVETTNPDFTADESSIPDNFIDDQPAIIQTQGDTIGYDKAITLTPSEINMRQFVLNVDTRNQNILTIGTNGTESIYIEKVELVKVGFNDDSSDGFDFREKACKNKTLRGAEHCEVEIYWAPHFPGNVQNNIKITWYETRLGPSNAKAEFVSVRGSAVYPAETGANCVQGENCSLDFSNGSSGHRLAIGPNGEIIGYIGENGLVFDNTNP